MLKRGGLFHRRVANKREQELRSNDHISSSVLPIEGNAVPSKDNQDNQHYPSVQRRVSGSSIVLCEPFSLLAAFKRPLHKEYSRERVNTFPRPSSKGLFEHHKDQSEVSGLSNDDSNSSILEVTGEANLGHAVPCVMELNTNVHPAPPSEQDASLIPWTIQVLDNDDDNSEPEESQGRNDSNSLWFRIYFQPDQDFVYYKGEEIINYVRDLLEFQGRSVFRLQHMSAKEAVAELGANEVIGKLREVIDHSNICEV